MTIVLIRSEGEEKPPVAQSEEHDSEIAAHIERLRRSLLDRLGEDITPPSRKEVTPTGPMIEVSHCIQASLRYADKGGFLLMFPKHKVVGETVSYVQRANAWLARIRENEFCDSRMKKVSELKPVQVCEKDEVVAFAGYYTINSARQIEKTNTGFEIRPLE